MKKLLLLFFLLVSWCSSFAQMESSAVCAHYATCSQVGVNSLFSNPAGLSQIGDNKCFINLSNDYALPQLWNVEVGNVFGFEKSALPLTIHVSGPKSYLNLGASVGYSMELSPDFYVGASVCGAYTFVAEATNDFAFGTVIGAQYRVNERTMIGMMCDLSNVFAKKFSLDVASIVIKSAFSYYFTDNCGVNFELSKNIYSNISVVGSFEIALTRNMFMLAGYDSAADELFCSFTLQMEKINVVVAVGYGFMLGASPQIMIVI